MDAFPEGLENLGLSPWALAVAVVILVLLIIRYEKRKKRVNRALAIEIAAVEQYLTQILRESVEGKAVAITLYVRNAHGTVWHNITLRPDHPDFLRLERGHVQITNKFIRLKYCSTKQQSGSCDPGSFLRLVRP